MPDPDLLARLREAGHAMDLNMDWPLFEQAANEIAWLRNAHQAMTDAFREEMDENLRLRELGGALPDENITAMTERVIAERNALRKALRLAREGYASEAATCLPVLPQWRERTMALIDEALKD